MRRRFLQIALLLMGISFTGFSQMTVHIETDKNLKIDGFQERLVAKDTLSLIRQLASNLQEVYASGFLLATYGESIQINDSTFSKKLYVGQQFKWASLSKGNVPEGVLSQIGYREQFYKEEVFKPNQLGDLFDHVLDFSQNNGYPFASIRLDSIKIKDNKIEASLYYEPGILITYDSVIIKSNTDIKPAWLAVYLDIATGEKYSQKKVDRIPEGIDQLIFVRMQRTPTVVFKNSKAEITIELEKVKSNSIDGIIGFLPNEKPDGSLLITGQLDLNLQNLFNSGKELSVKWQSLKPRSQLLDLKYKHRNFLRSPLDIKATFYLLKEDSIFINRKGALSIAYQNHFNTLSFFTSLESSRKLNGFIENNLNENDVLDFNINYYGLRFERAKALTTSGLPKGVNLFAEVSVGRKRLRNIGLLQQTATEKLNPTSTQFKFNGEVNWSKPISKSISLFTKLNGGKLLNDQLYLNDLFRVGGLQSLRGFNENFFFASEYMVGTAEIRLYYENRSYLYTFFDQSYLYYNLSQVSYEDYPFGLGVGLNMATKSGILNLAFAMGKSNQQALGFSLAKFHFGYVAEF